MSDDLLERVRVFADAEMLKRKAEREAAAASHRRDIAYLNLVEFFDPETHDALTKKLTKLLAESDR